MTIGVKKDGDVLAESESVRIQISAHLNSINAGAGYRINGLVSVVARVVVAE